MDLVINPRYVSRLTRDTLALILAGGSGGRLQDLVRWRAKPGVYFGGKFRIIDFPLSNCMNSGIRRVCVLTQYKSYSLIRHLVNAWGSLKGDLGEFVEILPASQRYSKEWYAGTADAVYQNLDIIRNHKPRFVLVLAGDHVYKMDYGPMIAYHVEKGADMTVACIEVPCEEARAFGVMSVDADNRVTSFTEKPEQPECIPGRPGVALASMGNYVFNTEFLFEHLIRDADNPESKHDFSIDVIPSLLAEHRVHAYPFRDPSTGRQPYWRDVGTVDAFWEANMELLETHPVLDIYDEEWPILTHQAQLPPAKFLFHEPGRTGVAIRSMVSGGCVISGSEVLHSLLFSKVYVHSYSRIEDSVLLPGVDVARHCRIRKAVVDRGCRIPTGMEIGFDAEADRRRFIVSPKGVVLVTPEMLGQALHYVRAEDIITRR
ncbi:glucose-1-phosphate adenylyltransferase [Plasticicumulans lactativorans]|uniref:Glucose-1-phosphate adenylyltransferase n=1 Tax=Plasticicumulans lactativorans TaxID=1133106 RepID=A0A4V2SDI0_9GAMM|nr:glucose-1-phosphate adenylyltransferase [Plasticicumulans lactativorans]TCO83518.1 glucose-1-phosphate adenylyltransferase [Plasticicumulans lactativorans]